MLARNTLRGKEVWNTINSLKCVALGIVVGVTFFLLSLGAIEGNPAYKEAWITNAFKIIGTSTFANLEEVDVSTKPDSWTGDSTQIKLVKGANLKGKDLRYVLAKGAFLVNADLREANLADAIFMYADLRGANFQLANLTSAFLHGANLQRANFSSKIWKIQPHKSYEYDYSQPATNLLFAVLHLTNLEEAKFEGAYLKYTDLTSSNLRNANFYEANLQMADLRWANLKGTNFEKANLSGADLRYTHYLTSEQLDSAIIDSATKLPDYLK